MQQGARASQTERGGGPGPMVVKGQRPKTRGPVPKDGKYRGPGEGSTGARDYEDDRGARGPTGTIEGPGARNGDEGFEAKGAGARRREATGMEATGGIGGHGNHGGKRLSSAGIDEHGCHQKDRWAQMPQDDGPEATRR